MVLLTTRKEGFSGFFKGGLSPMLGEVPIKSFLFAMATQTDELLASTVSCDDNQRRLLAGMLTGAVGGICNTPIEMLKCRAQISGGAVDYGKAFG